MVYYIYTLNKIFRNIERNDQIREVKLKRGYLQCDCKDSIYTGLPCRHMVALATKEKGLSFKNLPFNKRWKLNYYKELIEDVEPQELSSSPNNQPQELSQTKKNEMVSFPIF